MSRISQDFKRKREKIKIAKGRTIYKWWNYTKRLFGIEICTTAGRFFFIYLFIHVEESKNEKNASDCRFRADSGQCFICRL
jgi:hypothetical protein